MLNLSYIEDLSYIEGLSFMENLTAILKTLQLY